MHGIRLRQYNLKIRLQDTLAWLARRDSVCRRVLCLVTKLLYILMTARVELLQVKLDDPSLLPRALVLAQVDLALRALTAKLAVHALARLRVVVGLLDAIHIYSVCRYSDRGPHLDLSAVVIMGGPCKPLVGRVLRGVVQLLDRQRGFIAG